MKKEITTEMWEELNKPLPKESISKHPTKPYLSTIKAIYVTERINNVFGVGSWFTKSTLVDKYDKMVVVQTELHIPEYGFYAESYGGNDNNDIGDAYKGAVTDAITKIAAHYLHIGIDVFKGLGDNTPQQPKPVDIPKIKTAVSKIETVEELQDYFKENQSWRNNKTIISLFAERKNEIMSHE